MMNCQYLFACVGLSAIALVGCGGAPGTIAKTTGQVTYQGDPVEGATVTMSKEDGSMFATAITDAQGNFNMMCQVGQKQFPGAPIGPVNITITKFEDKMADEAADPDDPTAVDKMYMKMLEQSADGQVTSDNQLPGQYAAPQTSGLKETIDKDPAKNVFTFALE